MDIVKVTGLEENVKLFEELPFEVSLLRERVTRSNYYAYYQIENDDGYSLNMALEGYEVQATTAEELKNEVNKYGYLALSLTRISELLQLSIIGATIYEPYGDEPPSISYYKCENGTFETTQDTDDKTLKKRAEKKLDEFSSCFTEDEEGEGYYWVP